MKKVNGARTNARRHGKRLQRFDIQCTPGGVFIDGGDDVADRRRTLRTLCEHGDYSSSHSPLGGRPRGPHQTALHLRYRVSEEAVGVSFADERLAAIRGGLTAEEYRCKLIGPIVHVSQLAQPECCTDTTLRALVSLPVTNITG